MDQEYERRLLRQINHQNLPAEARLSKVRPAGGHDTSCCDVICTVLEPTSVTSVSSNIQTLLYLSRLSPTILVWKCDLQSCQRQVR